MPSTIADIDTIHLVNPGDVLGQILDGLRKGHRGVSNPATGGRPIDRDQCLLVRLELRPPDQ